MKTYVLFSIGCLLPLCLSAQPSRPFGSLPRWYIGTDAYLRQENFILDDPGGQVAPSDWMWNFSYGFNAGYRPTQWLALETGMYRFTYANRINYRFNLLQRQYSSPASVGVIPLRVYLDPLLASNIKIPSRMKIQFMAGVSWGQHRKNQIIGRARGWGSGISIWSPDTPNEVRYSREYTTQLLSRHSVNIESGVNVQYRLRERVFASVTYGYTFGLNPMVRTDIRYQMNTPNGPTYEATQSSKGSGQTLMVGLKYGFGR